MQRWRRPRPRKGPLPFRYVLLLSFLIFVILTVQGLVIVEKGIRPTLIHIAKMETQKIATRAINDAISKKIVEQIDLDELILIDTDRNGDITSVRYNTQIYNRVVSETVMRVQRYLQMIEQGQIEDLTIPDGVEVEWNEQSFLQNGIIHTIPLGQATNNALLAHLGPLVPVRFSAIGDVKANLSEKIESTGINNTYIRVSVDITVDVKVVIPFATDTEVVQTTIPVAVMFVQGQVPQFYNHGGGDSGGMPAPAIISESELRDFIRENQ